MEHEKSLEHVKISDLENSLEFSNIIIFVTISFCFWSIFYKLLNSLNPSKGSEWNFNIVAICFYVLIVVMSFICIVCFNSPMLAHLDQPSNTAALVTMCFSLGYFCYDTLWYVSHCKEKKDVLLLIHHIITIIIHCIVLWSGACAEIGTNVLFATEISTPLASLRWFMREKQMKTHILYHINDFALAAIFLIFRLGIGSWYMWTLLTGPSCPLAVAKVFLCGIYLISVGFAITIIIMLYYKIKKLTHPADDHYQGNGRNPKIRKDPKSSDETDVNTNQCDNAVHELD